MEELRKEVHEIGLKIDHLSQAFPGGDVESHRKAHEAMIQAAKAQEIFWQELRLDLVKKGIWAVLMTIIGLLVVGIGAKMGFVAKL